MRLFAPISVLSVAVLTAAQAQNSTVILVGSVDGAPGGIFQFIPPSVNATNGTTITFKFTGAPGNHSVTQSTFTDPCNPMFGGFDSGWVLIPQNNVSQTPEWNLTITDDRKPLWFFCKQLVPLTHCSAGMVGAINAPTTGNNTLSAYQANAKAFQGPSGQGEGSLVGAGASASTGPGPIVTGAAVFSGVPVASGTATAPGGNPSSTGASGNGVLATSINSFAVLLVAVLGITLA